MHTIGTAILIYLVLPDLDVIKGAMLTNCVAFIPGLFGTYMWRVGCHSSVIAIYLYVTMNCSLQRQLIFGSCFSGEHVWRIKRYFTALWRNIFTYPLSVFCAFSLHMALMFGEL